jgi:hypothetical protein
VARWLFSFIFREFSGLVTCYPGSASHRAPRQTQQASDPLASGLTPATFRAPRVGLRVEVIQMNVLAFSSPGHPVWRWRIVGYHGETIEESYTAFPTIAEAVAEGRERLQRHPDRDAPIVRRRWVPS